MKTSEDIKALFEALPLQTQRELLEHLLMEQELQGKVLQEAGQDVVVKRNKKPCLIALARRSISEENKKVFKCIAVMLVKNGRVKQQEDHYTILS
jgi:hypothetical protein